jgi:hypothetical protein
MSALADLLEALEQIAIDDDWCMECGGSSAGDVAVALAEYRIAERYEQTKLAVA